MIRIRTTFIGLSVVSVLSISAEVSTAQESSWIRRHDFTLPARVQTAAFSIGSKGYIAAGSGDQSGTPLHDLQEYDPATDTWTARSSLPIPLRGCVAFTVGQKAYIATGGGLTGFNHQLFEWDQFTNTWSGKTSFPEGQGRISAVGISFGNRGYVATGLGKWQRALNDMWEYDPSGNIWSQKAPLPGSGRCYATAFAIHDRIYIGLGNNGQVCLKDWWEFTPETNSWRRMHDFDGSERAGAVGFSVDGKGYIVGGVDNALRPLRDVWEFDPIRNTWTQLQHFPGSSRGYGAGFVIGSTGYIVAGISQEGYLSDIWKAVTPGMGPVTFAFQVPKDDPTANPVVIAPNPFFYRFFVKMRSPYTGPLELTVSDMGGRVVYRQSINKDAEYIVRVYEIDYLPDGLFVFRVRDPGGQLDTKQTVVHKSFGI